MKPSWPDDLELPSLAPIPDNPAVTVETYGNVGVKRTKWCAYHDAQVTDLIAGTCWDAEKLHPCGVVDAFVTFERQAGETP